MNMYNKILFVCLVLSMSSCFNYETQFDGSYDTSTVDQDSTELKKYLLYSSDGKFYLSNEFGYDTKSSSDDLNVVMASINNSHTKILYKEPNRDIQVFDIDSWSVERSIEGSSDALFFDYHPNNESIYYLKQSGLLYIDGPQLYETNPIDVEENLSISSTSFVYSSAVILPNDDIIISFGSSFGKYFARVNQTSEIERRFVGNFAYKMRTNPSGTEVHAVNQFSWGSSSIGIDANTLEDLDNVNGQYSVPHSYLGEDRYYYIDDDNYLRIPNGEKYFITGGDPTSLDY